VEVVVYRSLPRNVLANHVTIGMRMWIRLTQIRVQWSALVDIVMNILGPIKAGECKVFNKNPF
jgi:hypothetical protein